MDALDPTEGATVPTLAVAVEDLEWFDLPPQARRVLRHVDGSARLDEICSKTGDSLDDAISVVEQLTREGLLSRR
jgi:cell wall assembly regulator SMI1